MCTSKQMKREKRVEFKDRLIYRETMYIKVPTINE